MLFARERLQYLELNMAHGRFVLALLVLSSEFSHYKANDEDSFAWDVKDNTKFGVADSDAEVSSRSLVFSLFWLKSANTKTGINS